VSSNILTTGDVKWIEEYRSQVLKGLKPVFADAADRFTQRDQLLTRFNQAVDSVRSGELFRAVDEAHNELCIAKALLENTKPRFSSLAYEPPLTGCGKSIDFRASFGDGSTVFVDVKTIQPEPKDRWDQCERALKEGWLPNNIVLGLSKEWLGGEIWHQMFSARARMLEYTLELEEKIRDCGLQNQGNAILILALCGNGVDWREDGLEDFVEFYRTGRHRSDDLFSTVESYDMREKGVVLQRTVSRFACMQRYQGEVSCRRLNWNVQAPKDPEFDCLMTESEQNTYRVVLHDRPTPSDLGEMTETEIYGYVGTRLGSMDAAEAVLRELKNKGTATIHFDSPLGPKIRVEIRRVVKNEPVR